MNIDLKNIPIYLKNLLISLILIPFWIIVIYIYHPELYKTNDYLILGSLCISLTILSSLIVSVALIDSKKHIHLLELHLAISNVAVQVILLSFLTFFGYIFNIVTGLKFYLYSFLGTYFAIITTFMLVKLWNLENKSNK